MWMLVKVKEIWSKNPTIILVAAAMLLVLLYFIWGWIVRGFSFISNSVKSVGSTLSTAEAQAIASSIFSEVNSMITDEDEIVDMVKNLTLADYYKVQAEFGIQPYSTTFDNFDSLTGTDSNLTEVLNQTLSKSDKEKIKQTAPWLPIV